MTKVYSPTIEQLASFRYEVSLAWGTGGSKRVNLQRKGLLDLCTDLGIETRSRMNKKDLWELILANEQGWWLAEEILEISGRKCYHGPEACEQEVEWGTQGEGDEAVNTGIHIRNQAFVEPVIRNHEGLEALLYPNDPTNEVSSVIVQFLENLFEQRDDLYLPYSRAVVFREGVREILRGKFMDAAAAAVAKKLIQNDLEDFLRRYWSKNLEPHPASEAYKSFTRINEWDGKPQDIIKALAVGFDTFLSNQGPDRGWLIVRRSDDNKLEPLLHLSPNFAMKSEQKVAKSRNEISYTSKQVKVDRMKAMSDTLKESFLGENIIFSGREEALQDLRNQARSEWLVRIMPTHTPEQKHDMFLEMGKRKRESLKRARTGAKGDFSSMWAEVHDWKCKYTFYRHQASVAWDNLDHEKIEHVKQAIADINSATRGIYWAERQWMSQTPQAEGPGRWDCDSYEVIADLYDTEKDDEVEAAFWDLIRGKSTTQSRAKNKAKIAMLNGCSPVGNAKATFVDPKIAWELVKAQEEAEREANRPDDAVPMPELSDEEFQYLESASDEDLMATLEL